MFRDSVFFFFVFWKGIHIFIRKGCIKLVKRDSKDFFIVKSFLFQISSVILNFLYIK